MSLKVYFKVASFVTIIALLYIHMQMNIFELSYNGKDKEKIIHELNDSNGALSHQILTLKSANNLVISFWTVIIVYNLWTKNG